MESLRETLWSVALQTRNGCEIDRSHFLTTKTLEDALGNSLYKYNANQQQFCQVLYPEQHLVDLASHSKAGCLSVQDRIDLVTDTAALSAAGFYPTTIFKLLDALKGERSFLVLKAMISALRKKSKMHGLLKTIS
jgi:hypothetical protein